MLRYALPIKNPEIRKIQGELESISRQLRIPGSKPLGPIKGSVDAAARMIDDKKIQAKIVKDFAPDKAEEGPLLLRRLLLCHWRSRVPSLRPGDRFEGLALSITGF